MYDSNEREAIARHIATALADGGWHHFTDLTRTVAGRMPIGTPEQLVHNEIVRGVGAGKLVRIGAMIRARTPAHA